MAKMRGWISRRKTLWGKEWLWRLVCTGPRSWSLKINKKSKLWRHF